MKRWKGTQVSSGRFGGTLATIRGTSRCAALLLCGSCVAVAVTVTNSGPENAKAKALDPAAAVSSGIRTARRATRSARKPAPTKKAARKPAAPAITMKPSVLELGPGEREIVEIRLPNPSGKPTVGSWKLQAVPGLYIEKPEWDGALPVWGAKLYTRVMADADAKAGEATAKGILYVDGAGEYPARLPVRLMDPLGIEVMPNYSNSSVDIRLTNRMSSRIQRGRVGLKSSDRLLQDTVSGLFGPIAPGKTQTVSIPVIAGGIAPGIDYAFELTVQTWSGYELIQKHRLVFADAPR